MTDDSCLFCKIIAREIPSTMVHEDDLMVAIEDADPVAPVHQLLIPRRHITSAADLGEADAELLGWIFACRCGSGKRCRLAERGYRMVTNVGADGGQSVPHLHIHLLGGRSFSWPPG